ncbi:CU044_2847 family protein [Streptomyces sp. NPDC004520]|uniref:CU044_2847 family protein n=1 Tax=Streptomyces sp. NPDC004520 TaxID=3364702 RepID=UPI00368ADF02
MAHGIARIRLDDGTPVWARVSDAEELGRGGGFQDTGVRDRVVSMAGGLTDVVRGVVGSLRAGLDPEGSVEVAVSFGIELSAQSGKVIGVLADGAGKASVNVSLTWTEPGRTAAQETTAARTATDPQAATAAQTATDSQATTDSRTEQDGSVAVPAPEGAEPRSGIGPQRRPAADGAA